MLVFGEFRENNSIISFYKLCFSVKLTCVCCMRVNNILQSIHIRLHYIHSLKILNFVEIIKQNNFNL